MKALIVRKIDIETREIKDDMPYYREAMYEPLTMAVGKSITANVTAYEKTYERMRLVNPETKTTENYYVNVDERKLWNDLIKVSDGFVNSKIQESIDRWKVEFSNWELPNIIELSRKSAIKSIKSIPWYKRLFNKF